MPGNALKWATSKTVGKISEIAVMAPVLTGCVPGERRTYEERLREAIDAIASQYERGLPIGLARVPSIHFGRLMLIRPEQYLTYSDGVQAIKMTAPVNQGSLETPLQFDPYVRQPAKKSAGAATALAPRRQPAGTFISRSRPGQPTTRPAQQAQTAAARTSAPVFRTWLLTLVEFDGDLRVYMRDIANTLTTDFDRLFENCEEYPSTQDFEKFWVWIRRFQINTGLFYAPYSNLTSVRIRYLEAFKNSFDAFVAKVRSPRQPLPAGALDALFDEFLRETQQVSRDFPSPGGLFPPGQTGI